MPPTKRQIDNLSSVLKLLGESTRLRIVHALIAEELNVSQICRRFRISQPTISRHLGIMRMAKIVEANRKGKEIFYRVPVKTRRKMKALIDRGLSLVT